MRALRRAGYDAAVDLFDGNGSSVAYGRDIGIDNTNPKITSYGKAGKFSVKVRLNIKRQRVFCYIVGSGSNTVLELNPGQATIVDQPGISGTFIVKSCKLAYCRTAAGVGYEFPVPDI
mgnify:CR=1 FL=1